MKENVLDVLMYLFETYVDTDDDPEPDQNELRGELASAGFGDSEIDRALDWLEGLTDDQQDLACNSQTAHGTRVYNDLEQDMLECAMDVQGNSRLSCQIEVSDELDGLVVRMPEHQI